MKQLLIFILIFGIASKSFGQSEFNKKFKTIPPLRTKLYSKKDSLSASVVPKSKTPDVSDNKVVNSKPEPKNFSLYPKNEFINPGDLIKEKLNKIPFNQEGMADHQDQNLGNFKTKSFTVRVSYRDFGEVDGDAIKVLLNNRPIIDKIMMGGDFRSIDISLEPGSNEIDFQALNVGAVSPNTAEFQVYDDKGLLITANQWNLFTGFKATIIVVKE